MTRKLILQMQTSVDMYVAPIDNAVDWLVWGWGEPWTWDTELRRYFTATIASADTILLSNGMAQEGYIDHWAAIAQQATNPQSSFAQLVNDAHKVVFSHSVPTIRWANTNAANDSLVATVNQLKQAPGQNLIAFGGVEFATSLLAAELVDELHLIINPVILGRGRGIMDGIPVIRKLQLKQSRSYADGLVVSQYVLD